jgi:hypothetical protein
MRDPTRFCSNVSDAKNRSTATSPRAAPTVRVTFMVSSFGVYRLGRTATGVPEAD